MQNLFSCSLGQHVTQVVSVDSIDEVVRMHADIDRSVLWVCDTNTRQFLPANLQVVVLPCGEVSKNWTSIERIVSVAKERGLARDSKFLAVGGGVVCDMTAFAASIYMRGCSVSLVPTTLLAMVDASLGGKTAIDLLGAKNLVGTFYPAKEVYVCAQTLETLGDAEFRNGLGEVLKHAVLSPDDSLATFLTDNRMSILQRSTGVLEQMIMASLAVKRQYIERDPTEKQGIRDALNLGHTFAHALESVGNLSTWSHGEAVAWGVVRALQAGVAVGTTRTDFARRYSDLFTEYGFGIDWKVSDVPAFLAALESDKKKRGSNVRFVLMAGQGEHILRTLDAQLVTELVS
ncbi:MAG TPA: 3-dehydroquinate synthase [Sphaerochaeta sp.]|nr:MAG: hypothetical protein A2Y31_08875 [Spirochaetes bacterium GWC2_52_13]HCG62974.1 3-dehydroquinate synthase [Sphaerochaeta sp.]HCS36810.1 3-dehydroquinate synthase [Sphaerochaeta sp.]